MVDALREPCEVAGAVVVPVEERLDVEAVDHRRLPPLVARLGDPSWFGDLELREDLRAEHVDELLLLLADVVQVHGVEAEVDPLLESRRRAGSDHRRRDTERRTSSGPTRSPIWSKCSTISRSQQTGGGNTRARGWTCSCEQCNPRTGMGSSTLPGDPATHETPPSWSCSCEAASAASGRCWCRLR